MRNLLLVAAAFSTLVANSASSEALPPIPKSDWTPEARLTLARAWVGEADWSRQDHIAIGWVLAKRWKIYNRNRPEAKQVSFARFIRLYCSPFKGRSLRQRRVQALPWGDPVGKAVGPYRYAQNARRWARVRQRVDAWASGKFRDPCPTALHWGGTMDVPYSNWRPARCGATKNIFYTIGRRRYSRS
jgi:hypothetical protein